MERVIRPGEFYRHFKNKLYQIIAIAIHSETEEQMVVYQALYGDFKVYVRPLAMFLEEVDHVKYPEVTQKYRFERVEFEGQAQSKAAAAAAASVQAQAPEDRGPNPDLMRFLDTEDYAERMECLKQLAVSASQSDLESIYVVLDMKPQAGDIGTQTRHIEKFLSIREHYDGRRLR